MTVRITENHSSPIVNRTLRAAVLALLAILTLAGCSSASNASIYSIPEKQKSNHVLDQANILTDAEEDSLNSLITRNNSSTDRVRVAIITYTEDRGKTLDYATQVGREWDVSEDGDENGIVIAMEVGTENAGIAIANGAGDYISDDEATDIIDDVLLPAYQSKDYDGALTNAIDKLYDEAKYSNKKSSVLPVVGIVSLSIFVVIATWAISYLTKAARSKEQGFFEVEQLPEDQETGAAFASKELKELRESRPELFIDSKTRHAYFVYRMMMKNYASIASEYNKKVIQKQTETEEKYTFYHPDFFSWQQSYLENPHLYSDKIKVAQVARVRQQSGRGGYYAGDSSTYSGGSDGGDSGGGFDGGGGGSD